jgi:hypothetical protein
VTALWIGLLLGAGAIAIVVFTSWRHRVELTEFGTVSAQWLAEKRANDRHYSER